MDDSRFIDADDYYDMAYEWLKAKNYRKAEAYLRKAIDSNPRFIHAYIDLAFVYAAEKNYHDAMTALRKALEYDPEFDRLYYLIAKYSYKQGDYKRALSTIVKALELNPLKLYEKARVIFQENFRAAKR